MKTQTRRKRRAIKTKMQKLSYKYKTKLFYQNDRSRNLISQNNRVDVVYTSSHQRIINIINKVQIIYMK